MSRQPRLTADVVSSGSANGVTVHGVRPILIQPDGARTQGVDVNRALAEFVLLRDSLAERHPRVRVLPPLPADLMEEAAHAAFGTATPRPRRRLLSLLLLILECRGMGKGLLTVRDLHMCQSGGGCELVAVQGVHVP